MLMPKRVKHRKQFRGTMAGKVTRGNRITYGEFGLVAASPAYNLIVNGLDKLNWMHPAWQIFITVNVCAALTSSSTSAIRGSIPSDAAIRRA